MTRTRKYMVEIEIEIDGEPPSRGIVARVLKTICATHPTMRGVVNHPRTEADGWWIKDIRRCGEGCR